MSDNINIEEILKEVHETLEEDRHAYDPDAPVEVIGVRFKDAGKVYYFAPNGIKTKMGDPVIVKTARGIEFGIASGENQIVPAKDIVQPLREAVRLADENDVNRYESNKRLEKDAMTVCQEKILKHGLEMKLIEAEYTFDNSKLIFYFSAEGRIDFRELVRDLASVFRTRIELRQIGIRDEAKMLGGIGVCGRPFCCSTFLSDFVQVSIKMAKEQNISLNSAKISGSCGRLMCCLRYESDTYEYEIRRTPPVGSKVKTADGFGTVIEMSPLAGTVRVLPSKEGEPIKTYSRDDVTVLAKDTRKPADNSTNEASDEGADKPASGKTAKPSDKPSGKPFRRNQRGGFKGGKPTDGKPADKPTNNSADKN